MITNLLHIYLILVHVRFKVTTACQTVLLLSFKSKLSSRFCLVYCLFVSFIYFFSFCPILSLIGSLQFCPSSVLRCHFRFIVSLIDLQPRRIVYLNCYLDLRSSLFFISVTWFLNVPLTASFSLFLFLG